MNPFIIFWRAGRDLFDDLFLMIGANLLWLVMAGPLFAGSVWLVLHGFPIPAAIASLVNVLILGPTSAGLLVMSSRIVEGRVAPIKLFFEGMRTYYIKSWQVYGIWTAGMITLLFNFSFYGQLSGFAGSFLTVLFGYLVFAWSELLIYIGPLMLLQEEWSLKLLWRNALVMTFGRPVFSMVTTLMMGIIIGVSLWSGILALLLTFSFQALWGMRATVAIITNDQERRLAREQQTTQQSQPPAGRGRSGQVRPRE